MGPSFCAFKVKKARESGFSFLMGKREGSSISLSYGSISLLSLLGERRNPWIRSPSAKYYEFEIISI